MIEARTSSFAEGRLVSVVAMPLSPSLSFLQTEGRFIAAVVVVRVEMEDALAGAREGAYSWRACSQSVGALSACGIWLSIQRKQRLADASADDDHVPLGAIERLHAIHQYLPDCMGTGT